MSAEGTGAPALSVRNLTVRFGGVTALADFDLDVPVGARHGILGPNGSGKTTLFNAISGFVTPRRGTISVHGEDVTRLPSHQRIRLGLARTFQITTLFPQLTALENVQMAALVRTGHARRVWRSARDESDSRMLAESLIEELRLAHLAHRRVRDIGYGEQRQLEIALALATGPRILLLDEPTAGLSAADTSAVGAFIRRLPADLTVILVEHDLSVVFSLAQHLTVLQNGERIADGPTVIIRDDPVVKQVYFGGT